MTAPLSPSWVQGKSQRTRLNCRNAKFGCRVDRIVLIAAWGRGFAVRRLRIFRQGIVALRLRVFLRLYWRSFARPAGKFCFTGTGRQYRECSGEEGQLP
jgi:hypothetical protein